MFHISVLDRYSTFPMSNLASNANFPQAISMKVTLQMLQIIIHLQNVIKMINGIFLCLILIPILFS